jgi:hypothetical protein
MTRQHNLNTTQDKARQDKTRQDKTRQDKTRQDKTRQHNTRQGKTIERVSQKQTEKICSHHRPRTTHKGTNIDTDRQTQTQA